MKKNIRRRRADSSSDEEEGDGHAAGSGQQEEGGIGVKKKTLTELREEMKQRKARGGIQAASTLEGLGGAEAEPSSSKKRPAAASVAAEEEDDEEAERQKSIGEMMESTFTGMRYVKKDDRTPHEKLMEQYIKEKLAAQGLGKKGTGSGGAGAAGAAGAGEEGPGAGAASSSSSTKLSRQDKLRLITEEIHAKARDGAGPQQQEEGGGTGEGGPIAYSTGIAEVALPMEFRLRNIEATERAQQALSEKGRGGQRPEEIVGSMTTNYVRFRKEHAIEMRAREGKPAGTFRRPDGEGPKGRDASSDDQAYLRFHKRGRR